MDVDLGYTGNLINLINTSILILLLFISILSVNRLRMQDVQIYLNSLFLSILFLLLIVILLSKDFYVLRMLSTNQYELEKVVSVLVWLLYFLTKLFALNYILLKLMKVKRALFPKIFLLAAIYVGVIISVAFTKIYIISKSGDEYVFRKSDKFDTIIVLGAAVWKGNVPSPAYAGRLDKAFELLEKGFSDQVILTGSNAPFELSEARVGKIYLENKGLSSTKIYFEEVTTSTIEQVHFIKNQVIGEKEYKRIIVISDGFHLPRVIEIAKFLQTDFKVARSTLKVELVNNLWYRIREAVLLSLFWLFAV